MSLRVRYSIQITNRKSVGGQTQLRVTRIEEPKATSMSPPTPMNTAGTAAHR